MDIDEIKQQFIRAASAKPAQHEELSRDKRSRAGRNMNQIGGGEMWTSFTHFGAEGRAGWWM